MPERVPKPNQKIVDRLIAKVSKEKGYAVCGYWRKCGGVCRKAPRKGRKRCCTPGHGGRAKLGAENPNFKHGRDCKVGPRRLIAKMEKSRSDPQLLSLRGEISFYDVQLWEMIGNLDEFGTVQTFREMSRLRKLALVAKARPNKEAFAGYVDRIFALIDSGSTEFERLMEISRVTELKKSLVESERKAIVDMRAIITAEEQTALLAETLEIFYRNVTDIKILGQIEAEFEAKLVESSRLD